MPEIYPVGMADMRIAKPPGILAAYGIGSCVIVAMYDSKSRIGGFAHIMLPDSKGVSHARLNPKKFADTAIPLLYQTLSHAGIDKENVWAKLIGGAEMFPPMDENSKKIGEMNSEAAIQAVNRLNIPIVAKELGGRAGRSLEMDLDSGKISLTVLGASVKVV